MISFQLGITYWPRQTAFRLWEESDPGAIRDELAHIASLGIGQIRLCLLWEAFQPGPQRIGSLAFRSLEYILDQAHNTGLSVVPVLFPISIGGVLMLPGWANGLSLIDELIEGDQDALLPEPNPVPVVCAGSYRLNQAPDLFSYGPIMRAQRHLIEELVGYFGKHPGIGAWQLGEGLEYIHRPVSAAGAQRWYATMAEAIRAQHPQATVIGMLSSQALRQSQGPRPEHIISSCDAIAISAAPPEPANARRHSDYPVFLHHLTSALAQCQAIVSDLGIPTTTTTGGEWHTLSHAGRSGPIFFGDAEQQALYLEASLERLLQAGAAGAWLPAYSDYTQSHWISPPLDQARHSRSQGLIDTAGREKPAAQAIQTFAAKLTQDSDISAPGDIDPERYWRAPDAEFLRLWREWARS